MTRIDKENSVKFQSSYMGTIDYMWFRYGQESRRIQVRVAKPDDYELSISTVPDEIPAPGTITCIGETIPKAVVDAIADGSTWAHLPRLAGYHTTLA